MIHYKIKVKYEWKRKKIVKNMEHLNDWKFVPRTGIKSIFELKHIHTDTLMKHYLLVKNFLPFEIEWGWKKK